MLKKNKRGLNKKNKAVSETIDSHANLHSLIPDSDAHLVMIDGMSASENSENEIIEDFKGPLILIDGMLYDDEENDQTYKKRLR